MYIHITDLLTVFPFHSDYYFVSKYHILLSMYMEDYVIQWNLLIRTLLGPAVFVL